MISTNEVLKLSGLTYPMLTRLRDLGIIPKPQRRSLGFKKGVIGFYEDSVLDIIKLVREQQNRGFTLSRIAAIQRRDQQNTTS